ncbi:MAG: hypothetical protein R2709_04045 [Marmoricola sp.]
MTLASASAAGLVLMEGTVWSVVLGGVFGVLTGLAVPALIARVPEPVSEPEATAEQDLEPDRVRRSSPPMSTSHGGLPLAPRVALRLVCVVP